MTTKIGLGFCIFVLSLSGTLFGAAPGQAQEGPSKALEALGEPPDTHTDVLTDVLEKVPEEAKPHIEHAREVSKTGKERAREVLKKIEAGELPIGRPESVNPSGGTGPGIVTGTGRPAETGAPSGIVSGFGRPMGPIRGHGIGRGIGGGPGAGRGRGR